MSVDSGLRVPFLRVDSKSESKKIGRYSINPAAIEAGLKSLSAALDSNPDVIVADEIGKMELGILDLLPVKYEMNEKKIDRETKKY